MATRRTARTLRTLELRAPVVRFGVQTAISQAEARVMFEASDRTLRDWALRGMPVKRGRSRQRTYPLPSAHQWVTAYRQLMARSPGGRAPAHLSIEQARTMDLEFQHRQWPADFVIVPLDWDHPAREDRLRKAAAGCEPPPAEDA